MTDVPVDRDLLEQAIRRSRLTGVSKAVLTRLFAGAAPIALPPGPIPIQPGASPDIRLIVDGVGRIQVLALDGREATGRYLRPGDILGLLLLVGWSGSMPFEVRAMTPMLAVQFDAARFLALAKTEPEVAWAVTEELAAYYQQLARLFTGAVFGDVRQQVARQLLDLAALSEPGPSLIAALTHQDLADAVGTSREVVTRAIAQLRAAGLIDSRRHHIVLRDPAGLADLCQQEFRA